MRKRQKNHHSVIKAFIAIIIFLVIYDNHNSLSKYKSSSVAESKN